MLLERGGSLFVRIYTQLSQLTYQPEYTETPVRCQGPTTPTTPIVGNCGARPLRASSGGPFSQSLRRRLFSLARASISVSVHRGALIAGQPLRSGMLDDFAQELAHNVAVPRAVKKKVY